MKLDSVCLLLTCRQIMDMYDNAAARMRAAGLAAPAGVSGGGGGLQRVLAVTASPASNTNQVRVLGLMCRNASKTLSQCCRFSPALRYGGLLSFILVACRLLDVTSLIHTHPQGRPGPATTHGWYYVCGHIRYDASQSPVDWLHQCTR